MCQDSFRARYAAAMVDCGGRCPMEAGALGRPADHECRHGRLPFDSTPPCGCWAEEGAALLALPDRRIVRRDGRRAA